MARFLSPSDIATMVATGSTKPPQLDEDCVSPRVGCDCHGLLDCPSARPPVSAKVARLPSSVSQPVVTEAG